MKKYIIILITSLIISISLISLTIIDNYNKPKVTPIDDSYLAYFVDGQETNTIPEKGNYDVSITCDKGANATWDYDNWAITIYNATQTGTRCSVTFTTVEVDTSGASVPELYAGLIPITYDKSNNIVVADINKVWYNYDKHNWANAILIDQSNANIKNKYINVDGSYNSGAIVSMSDILQMYVWVPRYKYKLFNVEGAETTAQMIEVEFESKDSSKSTGSTNGEWLTHPAFTFGTTELNGIWVGKFESSNSTSDVKIIPNVSSLRNINLASMFNASRAIESNSKYGLDANTIDTHMMKNMEWGAVAYLSQSKYGKYNNPNYTGANKEVYINNSSSYITGSSGGSPNAGYGSNAKSYAWNVLKVTKYEYVKSGENNQTINPTVTNDTTYPWSLTNGVYKSTTQGQDNSTTNLIFNFNLPQTGELSFDWTVSSESVSWDYIYYTITKDGNNLTDTGNSTKIGGTSYGTDESSLTYNNVTKVLEPGTYTITFTYIKDSSEDSGTDAGYVKNLSIKYGAYTLQETYTEENGVGASTTGNIYGIYDMSGGAWEYVMGNMTDSSGAFYPSRSGFTSAPDSKYYDSYTYGTSWKDYSRGHLGDATKEVLADSSSSHLAWNNDYATFVTLSAPWFIRGGLYDGSSDAGVFYFSFNNGVAESYSSFRVVLSSE